MIPVQHSAMNGETLFYCLDAIPFSSFSSFSILFHHCKTTYLGVTYCYPYSATSTPSSWSERSSTSCFALSTFTISETSNTSPHAAVFRYRNLRSGGSAARKTSTPILLTPSNLHPSSTHHPANCESACIGIALDCLIFKSISLELLLSLLLRGYLLFGPADRVRCAITCE